MRAAAGTSTRAVLLAASGQKCWPPTGSFVAAYGQDLMAADNQADRAPGTPMKAHPATPYLSASPTARTDASEIVVYTRPGCPYCFILRAGLRRAGLTFREINIWENPEAAAFVRSVANGNETVPTVTVGHVSMVNPSARRVRSVAGDASGLPSPKRRRWFRRSDRTGETA